MESYVVKLGAKRSRTSKQPYPFSRDLKLKSSSPIASAAKVASSEDLLIQILLHVPVKTLLNFKSVGYLSLLIHTFFVFATLFPPPPLSLPSSSPAPPPAEATLTTSSYLLMSMINVWSPSKLLILLMIL